MKQNDVLIGDDYDLLFEGLESFDFKISDSSEQEIELILLNGEGQLKQYPTFGVDIKKMNNGQWTQTMKAKIKKMLEIDGFTVNSVEFSNGQINVDAVK